MSPKSKAKKIKVAIYVRGGVVQDTKANQDGVDITIFDVDDMKETGTFDKDIDRRWNKILDECHYDTV